MVTAADENDFTLPAGFWQGLGSDQIVLLLKRKDHAGGHIPFFTRLMFVTQPSAGPLL